MIEQIGMIKKSIKIMHNNRMEKNVQKFYFGLFYGLQQLEALVYFFQFKNMIKNQIKLFVFHIFIKSMRHNPENNNKIFPNVNKFLIYQLGTNNWQRQGQFAPGSGIIHEAHHNIMNTLPGIVCYSMYPSQKQSPHQDSKIRVFKLNHPIPICESVSPVSNYRWHSMSNQEFQAYRERLQQQVYQHMSLAQKEQGQHIRLAIAHHSFLNPLVLRNVLRRRYKQGKPKTHLACFIHGTALKMYAFQKQQINTKQFPLRFLPLIQKQKIFNSLDGVNICFAISNQQVDAFHEIFSDFPLKRICISPNGINQMIFHQIKGLILQNKLSQFKTIPYQGSPFSSQIIDGKKYKRAVIMVSKFADWKRIPALLYSAKKYQEKFDDVATIIVGSGPLQDQIFLQNLAFKQLKLKHTYFLGSQPQQVLAQLYTISNIGVFPSYKQPFGMVFVQCMACGTPVIGAASGGPLDFVDQNVGHLIKEPVEKYDYESLSDQLSKIIQIALNDNWKLTKKASCIDLVNKRFSVKKQCTQLLESCRKILKLYPIPYSKI